MASINIQLTNENMQIKHIFFFLSDFSLLTKALGNRHAYTIFGRDRLVYKLLGGQSDSMGCLICILFGPVLHLKKFILK